MKRTELTKKDIQNELLNMLKLTDSYLRENDIKYSIIAGTLLGAIRHKGFIPWDDDIDLAIKRVEYNKLVKLLKKNNEISECLYAEGIELQTGDIPFIKIINHQIEVEENLDGNINKGYLWIDIFPIDNIPNHFQKLFFLLIDKFYKKCYFCARYFEHNWKSTNVESLYSKLIFKISKRKGSKYYGNKLIKFLQFSNKTNYVGNCIWGVGLSEKVCCDVFSEYVDYQFENIKVQGIKNADVWLTKRYGDYMTMPPEENRVTHKMRAWKYEK